MKLSNSTAHRLIDPKTAALVLAALRLRLQIEPNPKLNLKGASPRQ